MLGSSRAQDTAAERVIRWWQQAEAAVQAGQPARARRFLRWIVAACPDDEEGWLWLARLQPDADEQVSCLQKAYTHLPQSVRVRKALRQARARQLAASVGDLRPAPGGIRCLPDDRHVPGTRHRTPPPAETPERSRQTPSPLLDWAGWLAFLLPLLVYLLTACPTVYSLDSAEFSAAVYVLGIVRATGYPLYLLLGKLFTLLLPVGDIAFRLNVMSAVCAAGTTALLYRILRRLTGQRAAALAASLLFAFSYYFWAQAVVAEVYTLHTLLMAAVFWFLLRWEETRRWRQLVVAVWLYGLSFGNHMSTLLLAPGIGLFILLTAGREVWRPRRFLPLLASFLAGLAIYVYIPLRYLADPAFNYAGHFDATGRFIPLDMTRPENLWWLVTGKGFQGLMFDYTFAELVGEIKQEAHRLWATFLGVGLLPGLLGIWVQARRRQWAHLALFGLSFLTNLVFFVNYRVVDKETMFLPVYLVGAVWVGEGFAWLIDWAQGRRVSASRRTPLWAWGLAALAFLALAVNWPLVDIHNDTRARDRAEAALALAGPDAIILGWWTSVPSIHYQQLVEGRRPDVLVINRFLIGAEEMYTLIDSSLGRRPVYVMELDEGLITVYRPVPVGPMFELTSRTLAAYPPAGTP